MNIGFFGDSYVDLIWHKFPEYTPEPNKVPWSMRLLNHYNSPILNSGLGGSNQFYAVQSWKNFINSGQQIDYAIFTFTWQHRLYSKRSEVQSFLSNWAERRKLGNLSQFEESISQAVEGYYSFLESSDQVEFLYELMVKWILDLPKQYPGIKFIFLPNTELARVIALRNFHSGVLLDFAFETLSANEGELVGQDDFDDTKYGHLFDATHERFKNQIVDIIDKRVYNTIIPINYKEYKL
jgi:hypothetical protein